MGRRFLPLRMDFRRPCCCTRRGRRAGPNELAVWLGADTAGVTRLRDRLETKGLRTLDEVFVAVTGGRL